MAEQKSEDTKPAAARRAVRPFVGPAGASGGSRPLLRPTAPNDRPRPAAFAPTPAPERQSLGTAPERRAVAPPPASLDAPIASPTTPAAPAFDLTYAQPVEDSVPAASAEVPEGDAAVAWPTPVASAPVRPVTSEMVAIDAFDAFDSVWGTGASDAESVAPTPEGVASPLDELSLGGGLDGPHMWTEEITAAPEQASSASDATVSFDQNAIEASWPEPEPADLGMPSWLADDHEPVEPPSTPTESAERTHVASADTFAVSADAEPETMAREAEPMAPQAEPMAAGSDDGRWPDPLLAEYAPYIPTPSSIGAIAQITSHIAPLDAETTTTGGSVEPELQSVGADSNVPPEIRISAALERLAERVRSGEIDVSSVAAEAPEAAVLASVLAALLGGSSSR